jgi:rhamnosyltransferase subunit B
MAARVTGYARSRSPDNKLAMRSAHIVVTTFGSLGDLYPFLAIGQELRTRGHRVTIATHITHQLVVEQAGLHFADASGMPIPEDRRAFTAQAFHPRRGPGFVVRDLAANDTVASYAKLKTLCADADLLVTSSLAFAAQILAEQMTAAGTLRWVSAILAPASFISAYDPPTTGMAIVDAIARRSPRNVRLLRVVMKIGTHRWTAPVRAFRRTLGLPAESVGGDAFYRGQHAPAAVLALFSPLIGTAQEDWPAQTVLTGFARYRQPDAPLDPSLAAFLRNGTAPLVFTLGSAAVHIGADFLRESIATAISLGRRALLFTGSPEIRAQLPRDLPADIYLVDYAAHATVFPSAAVLIHHGGIGTSAEALYAGRPMLVVPHGFDQYDNAARLQRIGVAEVLSASHYRAETAVPLLRRLLEEPSYRRCAQDAAERVQRDYGARSAANVIEAELAADRNSSFPST